MKFTVEKPDYETSPFSGMVRRHWKEAAKFMLDGLFSSVKSADDAIEPPRAEFDISYPRPGDGTECAARFEGLARSMPMAVALIIEDENLEINGINLRDYYARAIVDGMRGGSERGFGTLGELIAKRDGSFQQTVECGIMGINLLVSKDVIWNRYTQEEKDVVAKYMSEYGHYRTHDSNWRFFNLLALTFLKTEGYPVDETLFSDHLEYLSSLYAGDGWYRDGNLFDYYSAWEFALDSAVWCAYYGFEHEPAAAAVFQKNVSLFLSGYWRMFAQDGTSILWGRSGTYRFCASSALCAGGFLRDESLPFGAARRIMSGNLLQFITKEEVFVNGVPCLGFYGAFLPMVQSYSCVSSPLWCAKAFLCLILPQEHPFWNEKEQSLWGSSLDAKTFHAPGIKCVNHAESSITEIKTSKFIFERDSAYLPAYARAAFSSALPWEKMSDGVAEAMMFKLNDGRVPTSFAFCKEENGILYRTAFFDIIKNRTERVDMADIEVPFGTLRADRIRVGNRPFTLTLGHFGLPAAGNVTHGTVRYNGRELPYITATGREYQTAIVLYSGWQNLSYELRRGVNAVADESCLLYASYTREKFYDKSELLVALFLTKPANVAFTTEELTAFDGLERVDFTGVDGLVSV